MEDQRLIQIESVNNYDELPRQRPFCSNPYNSITWPVKSICNSSTSSLRLTPCILLFIDSPNSAFFSLLNYLLLSSSSSLHPPPSAILFCFFLVYLSSSSFFSSFSCFLFVCLSICLSLSQFSSSSSYPSSSATCFLLLRLLSHSSLLPLSPPHSYPPTSLATIHPLIPSDSPHL